MKDRTYEFLQKSVINANIGNYKETWRDKVLDVSPMRFYDGKVLDNKAKIGFKLTLTPCHWKKIDSISFDKIVIVIDGERLEAEVRRTEGDPERVYSPTEIIGLNHERKFRKTPVFFIVCMDVVLQPKDIKRIADAKDVGVYIDTNNLLDANGGNIKINNGNGSVQIEGIQGAMKRAYHYFVDVTSYIDYCSSFKIKQQKVLEEFEQRQEKEKQKQEQQRIKQEKEQREAEALWYQAKRKYKIMLIISIALFILCFIIGDSRFTFFLAIVSVVLFFYSTIRSAILHGASDDDGDAGGDNFEGE